VTDTRLVNKYNLFVLEVLKAWMDPVQKKPKTIHHHGYGKFVVDGEEIMLKSKMRKTLRRERRFTGVTARRPKRRPSIADNRDKAPFGVEAKSR